MQIISITLIHMKSLLFILLSVFCIGTLAGQIITGKVLDAADGEALAYVNIGVVDQLKGTITDENGAFALEVNGLSTDATVRFSMIGYAAQIFTVKDLLDNTSKVIKLVNVPVPLSEIVVKPGKTKKVGETTFSRRGNVCGWGGDKKGQGNEIGARLELGEMPVSIRNLHIHVQKQSFDSCLFRLHVRDIIDDMPGNELLTKNILIPITQESGWVEIDLSKYNLVFQRDIILSLEWVAVKGANKDRFVSVTSLEGKQPPTSVVLFSTMKNRYGLYTRWGSEAPWIRHEYGPCFYLTVQ